MNNKRCRRQDAGREPRRERTDCTGSSGPVQFKREYNRGVLREYQPDDFETLWQIDQLCFDPGIAYSRRELRQYMSLPGAFTLVADHGGKIEGYIVAAVVRFRRGQERRGHVITIDVHPEARRSGAGSRLLQAAESRMREEGCLFVSLESAVNNQGALRFYKRHGYSVIKTLPRYYNNTVDGLLMAKEFEIKK
jgi:[ribosomal protein S18]-alanine N-acetyltransferase